MIKLIWIAAFLTVQGPRVTGIPETETFQTEQACEAFAARMSGRVEDFVRGRFFLDWSYPVEVAFRCLPNGDPA